MISYQLVKDGFSVKHILRDGVLLDNEELEGRLLEKYAPKLMERSLFDNTAVDTPLEIAYRLRNQDIGFLAEKVS